MSTSLLTPKQKENVSQEDPHKELKDGIKSYQEDLKKSSARQISHHTDEELKAMFEQEEAAQKNPNYIPNSYITMLKEGLIINIPPQQIYEILPKELLEPWVKGIEESGRLAHSIKEYRKQNPDVTWEEIIPKFFKQKTLESLQIEVNLQKEVFELLWQNRLLTSEQLHDLPSKLFKSVGEDEFGISRLIADPLNNVPKMLDSFSKPEEIRQEQGFNLYMIESKTENSLGDTLRLTHRYRAVNEDDANKRAQAFVDRITGTQKRVFEACWAMANVKGRRTYTCQLTELMNLAYPEQKEGSYFSVNAKAKFFQDLIDLTETKLIVEKKEKPGRKKRTISSFILPFITIHKLTEDDLVNRSKESDRYPNQISISVLHNPLYENEKLYSVGAGIKWKTLELYHDDLQLAEYIQVRKSQVMKEKYITFTNREELIRLAKLDGIKHSGMANKKLLMKLTRLKEKGIILDFPKKVSDNMRIKIR